MAQSSAGTASVAQGIERDRWDVVEFAGCAAVSATAIVLLVLWHLSPGISAHLALFGAPLAYWTTLCIAIAGAAGAVYVLPHGPRWIVALGGALVAAASFAVLAQHVGRLGGPDLAGLHPPGARVWGRTDPATALVLLAAGSTLVLVALRPRAIAPLAVAHTLVLSIGGTALLANLLRVPLPMRLGAGVSMHAAISLAAYGGAVLAHAWRHDPEAEGGMPRWSPAIAAISVAVLFLGFNIAAQGNAALLQAALVMGAAAKLGSSVHRYVRERREARQRVSRERRARLRAEEVSAEAQKERRWLERLLDAMPLALVLIEREGARVTFANDAARHLLGVVAGEEISGGGTIQWLDPLGRSVPKGDTPIARAAAGERLHGTEAICRTPTGDRYLAIYAEILPAMHGYPPTVVMLLQDVSELKRAESVSMRLGRIIDHSFNEVCVFDATTLRITDANESARRNLGFSLGELRELRVQALWPEFDDARINELLEPLRTGERTERVFETMQRRRDGSVYPVEVRLQLSRTESPPCFVAIIQNVTARRRAEAERAKALERAEAARAEAEAARQRADFLAEASRKLSASLDYATTVRTVATLPVPTLADLSVLDIVSEGPAVLRAAVVYKDPSRVDALRALERSVPDLTTPGVVAEVLRGAAARVYPDLSSEETTFWTDLGLRGEQAQSPVRALGLRAALVVPLIARGRRIGALVLASTVPGRYGEAEFGLVEALASRAALAIDNARLFEEAQEAVRARDAFLSTASHDLMVPLSLLRMQLQSLTRSAERGRLCEMPRERLVSNLATAERHGSRLWRLVSDLLDVSRITGKLELELELENVDLSAVVRNVVARYGEELDVAGCPVTLEADAPIVGRWDALRLEQVVENLLTNAMKYGRGQPIEISVGVEGDWAQLSVRDHGPGIEPEHAKRIFEWSARAVAARHYGGLGLGLYLVRRVVESLGGSIGVESEPGHGAKFWVRLPLAGPAKTTH